MKKIAKLSLIAFMSVFTLSACNSGSGGGSSNNNGNNINKTKKVKTAGKRNANKIIKFADTNDAPEVTYMSLARILHKL